ncbi:hypothetical protein HB364_15635 [Pseudoflavitalea sp. X16]|uniref:hypothetical protein n=1 Tax=Paraflavitalea devenefica TaxID=2716334 RepID=UPI0014242D42|nr:hypothetical protein [Paraflavitalea devenefica]NII26520.1 hypothetical protein [Paraflavitalea devenefica]
MKRSLIPGCLAGMLFFLVNAPTAIAQKTKDIFSPDMPLTYFGVDFSEARIIGGTPAKTSDFAGINNLIVNETKKYDLPAVFQRSSVTVDIKAVNKKNATINTAAIKSSNVSDFNRLKKDDVYKIIKGYNWGNRKGIGVLFIMEGMSATGKVASMYVTFFDIASKKVLLTEEMTGENGGFGFRNRWATSLYNVMEKVKKTKYNEWKAANP